MRVVAEAEIIPIAGRAQDFVETFLDWSEGVPSPEVFRLWSAISAVASALERRVWVETGQGVMFPNLYVMLVASPGVGKDQAIMRTEELLYDTKGIKVAPDSMTAASMLDALTDAHRVVVREGKAVSEYHSLFIPANEFSVFCPAYDLEFLGRLNKIFDCPRSLRVRRKYLKDEVNIVHPQLNILSGAQPGLLASLLPEEAWSMGFTSRLIMVYAGSGPAVNLFGERNERGDLKTLLLARMNDLSRMYGRFWWDKEAARAIQRWHAEGGQPRPTHSKLAHYTARRTLHAIKLALIASASRGPSYCIMPIDVERALAWLTQAESLMPDIFREMVGKSDGEVIRELHFFMWRLWVKDKRPLHESRLINFLKDRVPHEKILRIIEIAERANIISREAGSTNYVPKPQSDHGLAE